MLLAALLGVTLVAQAAAPQSAASMPPLYDVFDKVLSPVQREHLAQDPRCAEAKRATDVFADLRDVRDGVTAMVALERCAAMQRVGNWNDFVDYTLTAAGAVAYSLGMTASEPKAFQRALRDLSLVSGYQTPASRTVIIIQPNPTADQTAMTQGPMARQGQIEMEAGLPMQNSITRTHATTHQTGYSGTYGELATEVGTAAQAALDALQRPPRPQEKAPK